MRALRISLVQSQLCLAVLALSLEAGPAPAQTVYDPAADFSTTSNPNGVWQYGWSATLGGPFFLDADYQVREGIDQWRGDFAEDGNPGVYHNGTDRTLMVFSSVIYQPDELGLHPGPNGEYAVLRWTAPSDGVIALAASFFGEDFVGPTTTDTHVLHNGQALFDIFIEGFGSRSTRSLNTYLFISSGDTIDFAVGVGRDGDFFFDSTGLSATITLGP